MNMFRKLGSPVALVAQGFIAGALLFTTLHPALLRHDGGKSDARASALVQQLIG